MKEIKKDNLTNLDNLTKLKSVVNTPVPECPHDTAALMEIARQMQIRNQLEYIKLISAYYQI